MHLLNNSQYSLTETSTKLQSTKYSSNLKEQECVLNGGGAAGDERCQESGFEKKEWKRVAERIGYAKTLKWETICVFIN